MLIYTLKSLILAEPCILINSYGFKLVLEYEPPKHNVFKDIVYASNIESLKLKWEKCIFHSFS